MVKVNEKNKIILMYLILVLILGSFLFIKCKNYKIFKDDIVNEVTPIDDNDNIKKKDIFMSKINNKKYLASNRVVPTTPNLDFETNYVINLGEYFEIPQIENDNEYAPLLVDITYYFMEYNTLEYMSVDNIDFNKLGTYKVHYKVTNHYNLTSEKDLYIEIVDLEKPKIEGFIITNKQGLKTFNPVKDNSLINKPITLSFSDNDKIDYIEYYKEVIKYDDKKIEEVSLMDIYTIENDNDLELKEDGKYIIRAYDRSGNYNEYKVTIDRTSAKLDIKYELVNNGVLVTISSNEKIKDVDGFRKINDYSISKIYPNNITEKKYIYDLANNISKINVNVNQFHNINVIQNNNISNSNQLNLEDGEIYLDITGDSNYDLEVLVDGNRITYSNRQVINTVGHYDVKLNSIIDELTYSFDIIDMNNLN